MQPSPPLVRRDDADGVATLTLDAPASRNALGLAMIEALTAAFEEIAADPGVAGRRVAGDGPALSSGHDLRRRSARIATIPTGARNTTRR